MGRVGIQLSVLLVLAASAAAFSWELPRLGTVTVVTPVGQPSGGVILLRDPGLADPIPPQSLQALSEAGLIVAVVDAGHFLAALEPASHGCLSVSEDLVELKVMMRQRGHLPPGGPVILAGTGAGGALAYGALAQSAPGQFSGAVAFGFNPELPGRLPLCPGAPYEKTPSGFRYLPAEHLNGFWRIATASPDNAIFRPYADKGKDVLFPLRPYDDLASAVIGVMADALGPLPDEADAIQDLPLVFLPVSHPATTAAVIYSGDGGWRDLDKQIGGELQKAGIPVVGVDTLRYFWHRQTPAAAARGLAHIIGLCRKTWGTREVLLVGYSFGADILPFMVNRLPPATGARIRLIALLGLSHSADFEIHMSGWIGGEPSAAALPLAPELAKLNPLRIQCFYGTEEQAQSGCRDASLKGAEIIRKEGGHHFGGDYADIARTIIDGAVRRGVALPFGKGPPPGFNVTDEGSPATR
jgi:type IV secretory pathway VirJ component